MQADLRQCSAFVQLLGRLPGRRAKFAGDRRFPSLQHDIAEETGKPILQWREPAPARVCPEAGVTRATTHKEGIVGRSEMVARARRRLYVVEPNPERHHPERHADAQEPIPDQHSAGEHEPWSDRSADEIADLDARLTGMAMLLRTTLRFMKD
jgi:hypothetical protein